MRANAAIFRPASMQPPPEPSNAQVDTPPRKALVASTVQQEQQQVAPAAVHGAPAIPVHQQEPTQVIADQAPTEDLELLAGLGLFADDIELLQDAVAASNEPVSLLPADQRDEAAKVMEPAVQAGEDTEPVEVTSKKIRMLPPLPSSIEHKVEIEQGYVSTAPAKRTRLQATEATEAKAAAGTLPHNKGLWTTAGYLQHEDKHAAANALLPSAVALNAPPMGPLPSTTSDAQMRGRKRSASPSPSEFDTSEVLTQRAAKRLAATNAHNAPSVVPLVVPASVCSTKERYVPPPVNERKRKSSESDGEEEAVLRGA